MTGEEDSKTPGTGAMISRFEGESGRLLLVQVLSDESILRGTSEIDTFVEACELKEVETGVILISQGDPENDLFFIISGSFDIHVNGRRTSTRSVGAHLGEIALADPTTRRTAAAIANERSLVLQCPEQHFSTYANSHPKLWRRLAVEAGRRLTERNKTISTPRSQPVLFIACSTEALPIANEIQVMFDYDLFVVEIWSDGIFHASNTPIEDLTSLMKRIDFALVLATPDDKISSRNLEEFGPRDNIIFELGLAIGAIGRSRTFILTIRGQDIKIPTDLLGVRPVSFSQGEPETLKSRLGPACTEIRKIINQLGPI